MLKELRRQLCFLFELGICQQQIPFSRPNPASRQENMVHLNKIKIGVLVRKLTLYSEILTRSMPLLNSCFHRVVSGNFQRKCKVTLYSHAFYRGPLKANTHKPRHELHQIL